MSSKDLNNRTVAYVPARLGSLRVPAKNLRSLAGQPLVTHVLKTASKANRLDKVFLNTESEAIAKAGENMNIDIYMRKYSLASNETSTDEILYDFAKSIDCERIAVINPTAPFLRSETIDQAVVEHDKNASSTLFTTSVVQRHLVLAGRPINFHMNGLSPRTQDVDQVDIINFIIFIIRKDKVISNFEKYGYCLYIEPLSFFRMSGIECHDIDDEDDFKMAESIMASGDYNG